MSQRQNEARAILFGAALGASMWIAAALAGWRGTAHFDGGPCWLCDGPIGAGEAIRIAPVTTEPQLFGQFIHEACCDDAATTA